MSLINETLHNLNNHKKEEVVISPAGMSDNRHSYNKGKSKNNLLILIVSFFIIVMVFFVSYHLQVNDYFKAVKSYFAKKSSIPKPLPTKAKTAVTKDLKENNKSSEVIQVSAAVQAQYYRALDLLNEGKAEQARKDLTAILEQNPDFTPAKQAISMINSNSGR